MSPIVAGCSGPDPRAPQPADRWQTLDEFLKQRAAAGEFSGTVLVRSGERTVLERGYGMADRDRGIANTPRTRFNIASLGKMFTAVAIADLAATGRLSFTDPVDRYLPGFAGTITLHHLLTHTAGLGDVPREPGAPAALADLAARIAETPPRFEPGARFAYSNAGFVVLGAVLEKVTGAPYADRIQERVLAPAGMTETRLHPYRAAEIPDMAHGYVFVGADGRPLPPGPGPRTGTPSDTAGEPQIVNPAGGASSTAGDLLRFAGALLGHRLLDPAQTDTVLTGKVDSPRPGGAERDRYGYGFSDRQVNGVRVVGHNGGTPGYEAQLDIYPDRGHTVILLANQDSALVPALRRTEELLTGA
ncbi:serine hydrolase domain-containing protein [Actinophytocola sp.]|uniref:serine hydrolase domain-containing protein n=1 Tax=Actinophytocola sp. TaxID=1872138 RepID=UPI002D8067D3|nr:serine hydrolase domain-containing protein [Actinophytocola sp.]HET9141407.1 serine hydrolase domain-containing protein [Actinophytocola sp.]